MMIARGKLSSTRAVLRTTSSTRAFTLTPQST
jgi:hypothetical protein